MKKIYLFAALVSVFLVSCKKCYECEIQGQKQEICNGDTRYEYIKTQSGQPIQAGDSAWVNSCVNIH